MERIKKIIHQWAWLLLLAFCITGVRYPVIGSIALVCMLSPVILAFFKGRMWCGNFCPRGSFNDMILSKISLKKKVLSFLKTTIFKVVFLVVLMSAFAIQLMIHWGNPVGVGMVFVRMILITTALTVILGFIYNPRTWCMICPMGTMAHYVSKLKFVRKHAQHVTFKQNQCINCKTCTKVCPMEIKLLEYKSGGKVLDANCLKCTACVEKCSKKALKLS